MPPTEVLSTGDDEDRPRRRGPWLIVLAVLVAVALLLGAGYFFFIRDTDDAEASGGGTDDSSQTDSDANSDSGSGPEENPDNSSDPDDTDADDDEPPAPDEQPDDPGLEDPRLAYEPLGGEWSSSAPAHLGPDGTAEHVVTEQDFDGEGNNWQAFIGVGSADPSLVMPDDPQATAEAVSAWLAQNSFGQSGAETEPVDSEPITIEGYDAYLLEQQFTFSEPDLEAEDETVYVVVVDFADDMGVFTALIPNTHPGLVDDAEQALDSLTVTE